jgi:hypothetical protein
MSATDKTKLDGVATGANNYLHPNHTGDMTSTGDGATTIAANAVSNAKLADMATATIKGRATAGTGDPEDLTAAQATALLDVFTLSAKGLAPPSGGGTTSFLRADGTWAAPAGGSGGVSDGDKGDLTVSGSGSTWTIDPGAVTNAKLASVATATIKGRTSAGAGDPEDLTAAQATALLDVFTSSLKGLAPPSGGGSSNFLRADGIWAAPPAGGGGGGSNISYATLSAARTLVSTTAEQPIFAAADDAFAVEAATSYVFECLLLITGMSATSGNAKFSLLGAGTATLLGGRAQIVGSDGTGTAAPATMSGSFSDASAATAVSMVIAGTGTALAVSIRGKFRTNAAGTIVPSVALVSAAAATIDVDTYFRMEKLGPNSTTSAGAS